MDIKRWTGCKKVYKLKVKKQKGEKMMAVSMGVLPCLKKEDAKILLKDMEKSTLKLNVFKECGKKLKEIVEKEGL
ncbi:hypothetical protein [Clostridium botulinum]